MRGLADRAAKIISGELTRKARTYLATADLAVVATLDEAGQPWASLLAGRAGFVEVVDDHTLSLPIEHPVDPILVSNLRADAGVGFLGMDLSPRRRRVRINGEAELDPSGRRLTVRTREVFPNCPKHIQVRAPLPPSAGGAVTRSYRNRQGLDGEAAAGIRAADTFFIASRSAAGGLDASHRGGNPGFVRVHQDGTLSWDDYAGNNLFQTLGNVREDPRVGLLFVSFENGKVLQAVGEAALRWEGDARGGTGRSVSVRVRESVLTENATPRRWRLREYSPYNPDPE